MKKIFAKIVDVKPEEIRALWLGSLHARVEGRESACEKDALSKTFEFISDPASSVDWDRLLARLKPDVG